MRYNHENGLAHPLPIRRGATNDYVNGLPMKIIAYKWRISRQTLTRWVSKDGIPLRQPKRKLCGVT